MIGNLIWKFVCQYAPGIGILNIAVMSLNGTLYLVAKENHDIPLLGHLICGPAAFFWNNPIGIIVFLILAGLTLFAKFKLLAANRYNFYLLAMGIVSVIQIIGFVIILPIMLKM
jgi:hypothetical protein